MDDMNLSGLLNSLSPEDIRSLQGIAQSLFGGQGQNDQQAGPPGPQNVPAPAEGKSGGGDALGALSGLDPAMMKKLSRDDSSCAFIAALKPLLSPERRHKADEALRIMRLLEMLPILRDQEVL